MRTSESLTLNGVLTAVTEAAGVVISTHARGGYDPGQRGGIIDRLADAAEAARGATVGPALDSYVDQFSPDETLIALRSIGCSWNQTALTSTLMLRWRTLHNRLASMAELSFELGSLDVAIPEQSLGSLRDLNSSFNARIMEILDPFEESFGRRKMISLERDASQIIDPFYNRILVNGKARFKSERVTQAFQNFDEGMSLLSEALERLRSFELEATGAVNTELAEKFEDRFLASIEHDRSVLKRTTKKYLMLVDHEQLATQAYAQISLNVSGIDQSIFADALFADALRTRTAYFNRPTHERFEDAVDALSPENLAKRVASIGLGTEINVYGSGLLVKVEEHYDRLIAAVLVEEITE